MKLARPLERAATIRQRYSDKSLRPFLMLQSIARHHSLHDGCVEPDGSAIPQSLAAQFQSVYRQIPIRVLSICQTSIRMKSPVGDAQR